MTNDERVTCLFPWTLVIDHSSLIRHSSLAHAQMTNDERVTCLFSRTLLIAHCSLVIDSSFVIQHSSLPLTLSCRRDRQSAPSGAERPKLDGFILARRDQRAAVRRKRHGE